MSSFEPIETERLVLRRFRPDDVAVFHAYRADPQVAHYQGWSSDYTVAEAQRFVQTQCGLVPGRLGVGAQIAIERKSSCALIGDLYLSTPADEPRAARIGYTLQAASQGRGYATEAVRALLGFVFGALDKHRVTAMTDAQNERSVALLERIGMRREAHFLESAWDRGRWCDEYVYAILRREWLAQQ